MTQNKLVQPGTRRHKEEKKEWVRNQEQKIVGR
jgi:hypothetical protein